MAEFNPEPPPLDLPAVPALLSPLIPLNPPMVGTASPFIAVDGENRDLVLESIRAWMRTVFLVWIKSWEDQLTEWEGDIETQLDAWMVEAAAYITEHAVAGLSFRTTTTALNATGTTNAVFVVDTDLRPLTVGDLVLTQNISGNYGTITAIIDDTHATVTTIGSLRGAAGLSFRQTATPIAGSGTTNVVLSVTTGWPPVVGDLVVDTTTDSNFGQVTVVTDATHVTVTYLGTFKGANGADGAPGAPGTNGLITSIVAGTPNVHIDSTTPSAPIVNVDPGATDYFTAPATMDAAAATAVEGAIAVLVGASVSGQLVRSEWVLTNGKWTAPVFTFLTGSPFDWATVMTWLEAGGPYTNLDMDGASATEVQNGSHPVWNRTAAAWRQDLTGNRFCTIGSRQTPGGSAVINHDYSVTFTAATQINIQNPFPTEPLDGTDVAEVRFVGTFASNASGNMFLDSVLQSSPEEDPEFYASFGTDQIKDGTFLSPPHQDFGSGWWPLAQDATGSPVILDFTMRIEHANDASSQTIAYLRAVYYDAVTYTVIYKRDMTLYMSKHFAYDGFNIIFNEAVSGALNVKAL